jgi:hypothetical protein
MQNVYIQIPNMHLRSWRMGYVGHETQKGKKRNMYVVLLRKHKERQIGRPKRRCDDNVEMNLKRDSHVDFE